MNSGKPGAKGLQRIVRAAGYSLNGLRYAWKHEAAFRQELALCVILMPLGLWLGAGAVEKSLLAGSCLIVLAFEILNSSIEAAVDRVGKEHHELSGIAKDMSSASVLIALVLVFLIWSLILWEHYGAS